MGVVFQHVGCYEIVREIGRGGMATVFLANDTRTNRPVALKLVPVGTDREAEEILEAERWGARLQEQFCHASEYVPTVYEYNTDGSYFYIAMEYLDGKNLSEVISAGALVPHRAVSIAIQLCEFLEAAHRFETTIEGRSLRSLVHADLKPRNIRVLEGDRIKVLDFGIAKALSLSRKVTRNDFGSIAYLSPERLESGEIDPYADFWAVGVLLYEMVSGAQPYRAPDTRRLEQLIRSRRPPTSVMDRCPAALQGVIVKLLAPNVEQRYTSATAIRQDLEAFAAEQPTLAAREGWPGSEQDEAATRRTNKPVAVDPEATRRTAAPDPGSQPTVATATAAAAAAAASAAAAAAATKPSIPGAIPASSAPAAMATPIRKPRWTARRVFRFVLLLLALRLIGGEMWVAGRAQQLTDLVPSQELDTIGRLWNQYDALQSRSGLNFGTSGLERALVRRTRDLTEEVFQNYRTPQPTVREPQWRQAQAALARAVDVRPDDSELKASLRYCEGHLHRINGEARKARKQVDESQQEFTDAVASFREAAELRSNWPDPFLGLMRTFIYGLEDVDRGADALKEAQRLGYSSSNRETAQLAEGYRARAESFVRLSRTQTDTPEEQESLRRAADAFRQAITLYSSILDYSNAARDMRSTQRSLRFVEQRLDELTAPKPPLETASARDSWPWA